MARRLRLTEGLGESKATGSPVESCPLCRLRGRALYRHYLEFPQTEDLASHVTAAVPRFPNPALGYGFDEWLAGVLSWHRQQRGWIEYDQRLREEEEAAKRTPDTWVSL